LVLGYLARAFAFFQDSLIWILWALTYRLRRRTNNEALITRDQLELAPRTGSVHL
jgi:hypothetical protein